MDEWQCQTYRLHRCQCTSSLDGYWLCWIVLAVRSATFNQPNGSDIRAFEKALAYKRLGQPESEIETGAGDGHGHCRK